MPDTEVPLKQAGRLFAALAVLRFLAREENELLTPDAAPNPKDSPTLRVNRVKGDLYDVLAAVRVRGGEHWKAASAIFQSIPGFLTAGKVPPDNIGADGLAVLRAGYDAQVAEYREKFAALLK